MPITALTARAARRLTTRALLDETVRFAVPAAVVGFTLACYSRLSSTSDWPWWWIAGGLALAVVVAVASRWTACRVEQLAAAIVIDERLSLHDTLSTALSMADSDDTPLTLAQRAAAAAVANRPGIIGQVRAATPISLPARWWSPVLVVLASVTVAGMPSLFGTEQQVDTGQLADARLETDEAIAEMFKTLSASPDIQAYLGEEFVLAPPISEIDPTVLRQHTVQSLTVLQRQLDAFALDPSQRRLARVQDRLSDLDEGEHDFAADTRRALAAGDFQRAADAMAEIESSDTDAVTRAEVFESLADDLEAASLSNEKLRESLREAGVQPTEEQDFADAITESEHLDDITREDLRRLLEDQQAASDSIEQMAKECEQAAERCRNPADQDESTNEPSECEQLAKDQQAGDQAEACRSVCASSRRLAGSGLASDGLPTKDGASQPSGGDRPFAGEPPPVGVIARAPVTVDEQAQVVRTSPTAGPLRRGDVSEAGQAAVRAAKGRVERGIDVQRIPRRYRQAVAAWFAMPEKTPADENATTEVPDDDAAEKDKDEQDDN
jgi:hypothetical protein